MLFNDRITKAFAFLEQGGPAIWAITALSVLTGAIILWKVWRFVLAGAWAGKNTEYAVTLWTQGDRQGARAALEGRSSLRAVVARAAMTERVEGTLDEAEQREEVERVARRQLSEARSGLRALELIATIAPLLGLLGTVLGMIAAFQTLQAAGSRADPAALAGGIWEALLTTAAGMAVAIPASVALTWFESVVDRAQGDMEDAATRIMTRDQAAPSLAAAQ
ncbi:MotA/TolQ/ExbB proton channel family protein [Shimia haliotis]|uniref:Biopolymer transport protein ExbB n=1 Tax=Shimia haliotis TaxID=1280847 RepID=A0A1I4C4D0_9RHOB|nr:MotA/TolQ/ExbB proton channel family protein [Shimia haliotis]SFK75247.1 biopolymer transport protein ExbB [Shimia haliotis]